MKKRTIFLLSSILLLGGLSVGTLTSCGDQLVEKDSIYTISASVNDDSLGKITLEKTTGKVGEVVKFSIDITPGSDAYVKELKINGSNVDVTTREFTPRKGTNSVVATLAVNTPVVETGTVVIDTKIVNGTVTADKTGGVVGDTINLTITPDSGYEVDTVKANNVALTVENNKASFTLVEGENLVTATFKTVGEQEKTGTVVIDAGIVNGTVTADKTGGVVGEIVSLTITPDSGFKLETLKANNIDLVVENNKASFALIEGENLVTATFVVDQVEPPVQKVDTFYFSDLNGWNGWGSEARVYLFNEDGPVGTAWPGVEMTQFNYGAVGEGINLYKIEDLNYTGATHIVFSTGYTDRDTGTYSAQNQTIDIDLTAKGENNYYQLNEEIITDAGSRGQGTWLDFDTYEETITGTVVLPSDLENGTVTASKLSGYRKDEVVLTVTPDENYELDYLRVDNVDLTVTDNQATFVLKEGNNVVTALFKEILPPVETGSVVIDEKITNGVVSADKLTGNVGDIVTLTVTPNDGYELETLKANNEVLTVTDNQATFALVKGENLVTATFKETAVEPPVQQIDIFYFSDLNGWNSWGSEARVYLFNEDGAVGETWPGTKLTQFNYGAVSEGVNLYVVEDLDYTGATGIIFLTGKVDEITKEFVIEKQTIDIDLTTKGDNNYYQLTSETEGKGVGSWLDFETYEETIAGTVVLPTEVANGTVSADKLSGYKNDQITLTLTPDENYEVDYVKVNDGENLTVIDNKATFALASGVNTVSVAFKEVEQEPLPPVQEAETFYFSDLNGWNYVGNYAWVYLYNEEGPVGEAWPGTEMTQVNYGAVGEGINLYKVENLDYTGATHIIFSTGYIDANTGTYGSQHQTIDIDLTTRGENNYYQLTSETEGKGVGTWLDFATFEETITGTVVLPTEVANGTVSADKLSGYKNDQITLTLTPDENYEVDYVKVNDGENLTVIDNKATFALASGVNTVSVAFKEVEQEPLPPVQEVETFYFSDLNGWNGWGSEARVYLFNEEGQVGEAWPGIEMTQVNYGAVGEGINLYKVENLDYTGATHIIFSTGYIDANTGTYGSQHQTIDIDLTTRGENNYYQLTSETEGKGVGTWLDFATFEETITGTVVLPTEVANGTVSADKLSGYKNDQITLTLTPDENYEVDYVKVNDGENLTVIDNKATFALASGVNTVSVAFKKI